MGEFELDKNTTLSLLKDLVFPLKDLIISIISNQYTYNVLVSVHEHDGLYPNGLSVDEEILELFHLNMVEQNATVKQIVRYLSNIDYIRLTVDANSFNNNREIIIDVKFSTFGYSVSGLNGFYKFGELPLEEDLISLVSNKTKIISDEYKR